MTRKITSYQPAGTGGGGGTCPPLALKDSLKVVDALGAATLLMNDKVKVSDATILKLLKFNDSLKVTDRIGSLTGTITPADKVKVIDSVVASLLLQDKAKVTDKLGALTLTLNDSLKVTDAFAPLTLKVSDQLKSSDHAQAQLNVSRFTPSGTPDNDFCGDAWTDQASTGTNHGTTSPLNINAPGAVNNSERDVYIKYDLTRIKNMAHFGVGAFSVNVQSTNGGALAVTVNWELHDTGATNPFTESTVTWAAPPVAGTTRTSGSFSAAALSTNVVQTITIPDATTDIVLGSWVYLKFFITGATGAVSLQSRENVAPSHSFQLVFQRN